MSTAGYKPTDYSPKKPETSMTQKTLASHN